MKKAIPVGVWQTKLHGFLDDADKTENFAAIGRLITAFNGIDVILNLILRSQLSTETKIGKAIIGGMRTGDMLAAIKRLAKVTNMTTTDFAKLEEVHQDINALKDIRDDAAHKVWEVNGQQMAFTNVFVARTEESQEVTLYSVEELNELARYAPHLSERCLQLFPDCLTLERSYKFSSREKPARLRTQDQNQGKSQRSAQARERRPPSSRARRDDAMKKHEK